MASRSRLAPVLRRVAIPSWRRPATATCPAMCVTRGMSSTAPRQLRESSARSAKYTSDSYPEIKRDSRFAQITKEHVDYFKTLLGKESAVVDGVTAGVAEDDMEPYNGDWMHKYRGHCKLVLKPASTEQVSKILKYCNENVLAVVPQGGNTGLVGGSVPVFDEIVVSTSRMNQIRFFDDVSGVLVADAGVILEVADQFLAEKGYIFPLDLGAKGSCHIGGNVSTNAGGLRLLRYGSLHGSVLGVEAVLPDGTILDDLSRLRKNNTGYDLKQLFIGGEGTIGMITAVSIHCPQRSNAVNVAFLGLESYEKLQQAFREAKSQLGEILSAFELMDSESQEILHKVKDNKRPLEQRHPFYCLIETSGSNADHDNEKLEKFLEDVMTKEIVADGVVAQDEAQLKALWSQREGITESVGHWGGVYKYDVSIPLQDMYKLVEDVRKRVEDAGLKGETDEYPIIEVIGYGHMGDSNLHLNVAVRRYDKKVEEALEPYVYEWIKDKNGSISAEHGLGIAKKKYIGYSRNETTVGLMKQIKNLYDPKGIMNPYKYI
ncbi:D-lactate dehydrogenase 2 mitochondrial precursor [Durotheca rogersii]|uniref:D-lactate dehydrogenase 2 mitochondrial precursor n=1 Tax=Durotheca rogersii TaxID=419775 RepID=UPI002220C174|nr:D-lactate dehydrogenase 2 mitochondrial precursor [Durotheca rogersii]KAI5864633.1 D-lactate dehydrogenase 2 mitochondrial precursor [Durotheca rogersii]